jgi:hypothetical protein
VCVEADVARQPQQIARVHQLHVVGVPLRRGLDPPHHIERTVAQREHVRQDDLERPVAVEDSVGLLEELERVQREVLEELRAVDVDGAGILERVGALVEVPGHVGVLVLVEVDVDPARPSIGA